VVVEKEEKQITSMTNKETLSNQLDIVPLISVAEEETTNNAHKQVSFCYCLNNNIPDQG